MMNKDKIHQKLVSLKTAGDNFSFENFSQKNSLGAVSQLRVDWEIWIESIAIAIQIFPSNSSVFEHFNRGKSIKIIGNYENKFEEAKMALMLTLDIALLELPNITDGQVLTKDENFNLGAESSKFILKIDKVILQKMIYEKFNMNELKQLCFELDINPEKLEYQEVEGLIRSIIFI